MVRQTLEAKVLRLLLSTPDGLSSGELQRRTGTSKRYSAWDIRKLVERSGIRAMLHTHVGDDCRLRYRLEAFDDDPRVQEAVEILADLSMTSETPGMAHDGLIDDLILTARKIKDRDHHA